MSSRTEPNWRTDKDPSAVFDWPSKFYGCPELAIEVCKERGLKCFIERPDEQSPFIVLHVIATRAERKSAQIEWCRRMAVGSDRNGWDANANQMPKEEMELV